MGCRLVVKIFAGLAFAGLGGRDIYRLYHQEES